MIESLSLRDYQVAGIESLRHGVRAGHKHQILYAPTGAGKTELAVSMMQSSKDKGRRAAFICDRVNLVDQTSARLDRYGIDHGVVQSGHWRRRGYELLQICSAQTLEKRGFFPGIEALYIDECHAMRQQTIELIKSRPDLTVIGLSATPFSKGLADVYSNVVNVTTTNRLIEQGWLVPLRAFAAVSPDMDGAKIQAGEWSIQDSSERGRKIVGDVVSEWVSKTRAIFGGPVKTIVFTADVAHGEELCKQFAAAGFNFQQISYKDASDDERRQKIAEFRKPDSIIDGLISCEVLTKGFDVADVRCGVDCRPLRKSLSAHVQQIGRVIRSSPGKEFALWLDHSGNYIRFFQDMQTLFENGCEGLAAGLKDAPRKEPSATEKAAAACSCGRLIPFPRPSVCPGCGKALKRANMVENVAGVMVEVGNAPKVVEPSYLADHGAVWQQLCFMARERKGNDIEAARRWAQAQHNNLYGGFALHSFETTAPLPPSYELERKIKSQMIRWAKGRQKAA